MPAMAHLVISRRMSSSACNQKASRLTGVQSLRPLCSMQHAAACQIVNVAVFFVKARVKVSFTRVESSRPDLSRRQVCWRCRAIRCTRHGGLQGSRIYVHDVWIHCLSRRTCYRSCINSAILMFVGHGGEACSFLLFVRLEGGCSRNDVCQEFEIVDACYGIC